MVARLANRRLEGRAQDFLKLFLVAPLAAVAAAQTPSISPGGIVNGASFAPAEISAGAVAQGSIFSLFGSNLSTITAQADSAPLPRILAGVRVQVVVDGVVLEAPLFYVSPLQINGVLPSEAPVGPASVRVIRDGAASSAESIKVVRFYPGIYTQIDPSPEPAYQNRRQVAVAHRPSIGGAQRLRQDRAAAPGGVVTLWATGMGGAVGGDDTPSSGADRPSTPLRVAVGGHEAEILFAGRTSCCVALHQLNIRLAEATPEGCFVPVQILGGGLPSNVAVIPVAANGQSCPGRETRLTRLYLDRRYDSDDSPIDRARTFHGREWYDPSEIPPVGSCRFGDGPSVRVQEPIGEPSVNVETNQIEFALSEGGGPLLFAPEGAAQLGSSEYRVTSTGGAFPDYQATLTVPSWSFPLEDLSFEADPREGGLHFNWNVALSTWSSPTQWAGLIAADRRLVCTVAITSGSFTVPPEALASLEGESDWTFGPMAYVPIETVTDGPETGLAVYTDFTRRPFDLGPPRLPTSPVTLPNGDRIDAELATTSAERQRGLMNRPSLAADRGMLFFDVPNLYSFWMSETLVPLDIIWLDRDRRIVTISADTPPCPDGVNCPLYSPSAPASYVLELAGGQAANRSLVIGDQLDW